MGKACPTRQAAGPESAPLGPLRAHRVDPGIGWGGRVGLAGYRTGGNDVRRALVRQLAAAVGLTVLVTSMAVSVGTAGAAPPDIPAPPGLPAFYSVPQPLPSGPPGTLIKSEVLPDAGLVGATLYRVMYTSTGLRGSAVPVTGMVAIPDGPPPAGGWPVVSWGHGTNGMADICAPSLGGSSQIPEVNQLVAAGYAVTASDYQGEGTPGLMPYIVGASAARGHREHRARRPQPAGGLTQLELCGVGALRGRTDRHVLALREALRPAPQAPRGRGRGAPVPVPVHLQLPGHQSVRLLPADGGRLVQQLLRQ